MNRRSILALIGFAPLATAAAALPRVADPVKLASTGGWEVSLSTADNSTLFIDRAVNGGSEVIISAEKIYIQGIVDDVNNDIARHLEWIKENSHQVQGLLK